MSGAGILAAASGAAAAAYVSRLDGLRIARSIASVHSARICASISGGIGAKRVDFSGSFGARQKSSTVVGITKPSLA